MVLLLLTSLALAAPPPWEPPVLRPSAAELSEAEADSRTQSLAELETPESAVMLVLLLHERGEHEEVVPLAEHFRRAHPKHPHVDEVLWVLGEAHGAHGHVEESMAAWTRLAKTHPDSALADEAYLRMGEGFLQREE